MNVLVTAFRRAVRPDERPAAAGDWAELSETLLRLCARGRKAHADLALVPEAFACALGMAAGDSDARDMRFWAGVAVEDLYLACACATGVRGAAAKLEALHAGIIARAVARVLSDAASREEATQKTRQMLLVGPTPKIAQYRGRGPLAHFVAVVAVRVAVSTGRAESAERRLRQKVIADAVGAENPEQRLLKRELRKRVEEAIAGALDKLGDRERLVLKLHLVSGMSAAAIAKSFDVNPSTIGRRMQRIREQVLDEVFQRLGDLARGDLRAVIEFVASQLDVNLSRLLEAR